MKRKLTVSEVSWIFNVTKKTIYEWAKMGYFALEYGKPFMSEAKINVRSLRDFLSGLTPYRGKKINREAQKRFEKIVYEKKSFWGRLLSWLNMS